MIYKLNNVSIDLLKLLKNKRLKRIHLPLYKDDSFWGKCLLEMDDEFIELTNEITKMEYYDDYEDIASLNINKINSVNDFASNLYDAKIDVIDINEEILSIEIVTDDINITTTDNKKYEVNISEGVVFKCNTNIYTISKGWYFEEEMYFKKCNLNNYHESIYGIDKIENEWSGENNISSCERNFELI